MSLPIRLVTTRDSALDTIVESLIACATRQTLNLYAMVSDNPETFADLDGHCGDRNGDANHSCQDTQPSQPSA